MKKYARFLSAAMTIALVSNTTSFAWNGRGHMMVAAVAYQKLKPEIKDRVDVLLKLNLDRCCWHREIPEETSAAKRKQMIFMIAATWADRIKSIPDYHTDGTDGGNTPPNDLSANQNIGYEDFARHKYWHFIDLPFSTDGTTLPAIPTPNARTQLKTFRAVLASPTSSDSLKSYDLSWFLHLIGDVHQPLHCTARVSAVHPKGDGGGNDVKIGASSNLHSFWDGVIGTSEAISTVLNAISALPTPDEDLVNDLAVENWINESFEIAKQDVYKAPVGPGAGPFTLTQAYKTNARKLAEERIALAGARLAKILNEELK
jgi:hypothetical protein